VADITVEVSSPGLVAYGSGSWGSDTYGGFDQTDITVGSVDAFHLEGWGRLTWGSLVWGQDFEDSTVSVTTPGTPTTWGYNTWGYGGYGQITGVQIDQGDETLTIGADVLLQTNLINTTTGTVFAASNFEFLVTGVELNTTVNNVFAGENVIVEVTTPGSPTTWGSGAWNSGAWGQITGVLSETGDETHAGESTVNLIGSQLNTTTASLAGTAIPTTWGFETWGSNSWQQTDNFIIGNANLTLNTNLLSTSVGSVDHVIDVSVEVTSPGDLPWGTTYWGYGSWGNIGGMDVEQGGEEVVVPSVEVDVTGQVLTFSIPSIGQIVVTGDANLTLNTNLLTTSLGDEDVTPNTIVTLSTNLLTSAVGSASGQALVNVDVTGVSATVSTGRLFITAWAVIDINQTGTWTVVDIAA